MLDIGRCRLQEMGGDPARLVARPCGDDPDAGDLPEPADELVTTPAHATNCVGRPQPDDPHADRLIGAARAGPGAADSHTGRTKWRSWNSSGDS